MSDIITNLEDLSPEDLKAVGNLINKLAKRNKNNKSDIKEQKEVEYKEIPTEKIDRTNRATTRKSKQENKRQIKPVDTERVRRKGGSRGGAGRTESVVLNNQNAFYSMRERNEYKKDSQIDKKLWGNREPTERPDEFEFVELQCEVCNKKFNVHPSLIFIDPDTRKPKYTCDKCTPRGH